MDYLLFRLYGPMASWGEIAVGQARHSLERPTRSALVGLMGAALGIRRDDDQGQSDLVEQYRFAIKMLAAGRLLRDYHTAQAPDSVGTFRYRTRRDEIVMGRRRLGIILSSREYRTDAQAIIALSVRGEARWSLIELAEALKHPGFMLYLGRKSCPLAAPLDPRIVEANGFRAALDAYHPGPLLQGLAHWDSQQRWLGEDDQPRYFWEGEIRDFSASDEHFQPQQVQQLRLYDQPLSRRRWQFQPRAEFYWMASGEPT